MYEYTDGTYGPVGHVGLDGETGDPGHQGPEGEGYPPIKKYPYGWEKDRHMGIRGSWVSMMRRSCWIT